MALARVKTWVANEVLTASDLNGEFNNILNNALSLVSPWTGDMAAGGNRLTGLHAGTVGAPSVSFTSDANTGLWASAADTVDIAAGGVRSASFLTATTGVNYLTVLPAAASSFPTLSAAGSDTDIRLLLSGKGAHGAGMATNKPFLPAEISGTPDTNALYRENVVKGWVRVTVAAGTPTANDGFNVTSITDTGQGALTVTWDRDFANANYASFVTLATGSAYIGVNTTLATGTTLVGALDTSAVAQDPGGYSVLVIGDQ